MGWRSPATVGVALSTVLLAAPLVPSVRWRGFKVVASMVPTVRRAQNCRCIRVVTSVPAGCYAEGALPRVGRTDRPDADVAGEHRPG